MVLWVKSAELPSVAGYSPNARPNPNPHDPFRARQDKDELSKEPYLKGSMKVPKGITRWYLDGQQ